LARDHEHVESHADEHGAAGVRAADVVDAEAGDRHRQHGQHQQKPRRQPVNRVRQRESGRPMHEPRAVRGRAGRQDLRGDNAGDDRCGRGAEERDPARHAAPPPRQQREDDDAEPEHERYRHSGEPKDGKGLADLVSGRLLAKGGLP
jgi:hypothetical protein